MATTKPKVTEQDMNGNTKVGAMNPMGKILDVRLRSDFLRGHLSGAVSWPLADFFQRQAPVRDLETLLPSFHLPPRHETLLVVGKNFAEASLVASHLEGRGRVPVTALGWEGFQCPPGQLEIGPGQGLLWEPPKWLKDHEALLPPPVAGPVLDLACGSGRALVWLAMRGYRTLGLDWQPEALTMGTQLASKQGVQVKFEKADLRDRQQVPVGPWAVILNFRFLQRELLARLPQMLMPGGVAMVRTFRHAAGYDGHPHRRHRLDTGELLKAFPVGQCEILAHEEGFDPDGRPAAGIVARRLLQ